MSRRVKRFGLYVLAYAPALVLAVGGMFQPAPWSLIVIGLALVHVELVNWRMERLDSRRSTVTVNNITTSATSYLPENRGVRPR